MEPCVDFSIYLCAGAAILRAVRLVALIGVGLDNGPRALVFQEEGVLAELDKDVAHLSPVLTPGVADNPVLLAAGIVVAPANNADDVVNTTAAVRDNATSVVQDGLSINTAGDGAAVEDLLLHGCSTAD